MKGAFERTVEVVAYDPAWPAAFQSEAARVRAALGPVVVGIEHVGSTAVPGLAAKPVIDLQAGVRRIELRDLERRLEPLGYAHVAWPLDDDAYPFFARPRDRRRTHHLHVCLAGSAQERRHLVVRDYLRAHPSEAAAYAALKRDLTSGGSGERGAYVAGKEAFVRALQARALAWAGASGPAAASP